MNQPAKGGRQRRVAASSVKSAPRTETGPLSPRRVYPFRDGSGEMRDLLGGKGAGVAEMTRAGMPVPPGFTITTEACREYLAQGGGLADGRLADGLWAEVTSALADLELHAGKGFGDGANPLLVSVRSGARFSMPGMMDTVLNLGLNQFTVDGLASLTGDDRFALDTYRRFIQMFGKTVKDIDAHAFDEALSGARKLAAVQADHELRPEHLGELIQVYKAIYRRHVGTDFPEEPLVQLRETVEAVFRSWNTRRAIDYRRLEKIPDDLGTAVNVQAMVFGNMGEDSGTGVAFTRNPITGRRELYGDYLANAQGEDVVAGIRITEPIAALKRRLPSVYAQFLEIGARLESHYRDVQDLEFTVEKGRLWMLQTRSAKRTGEAAVRIAVEMVEEGLITREEALLRVAPAQAEQLLHPRIDAAAAGVPIARGVPASPGAASGIAVFDADRAQTESARGADVILVRIETNPADVHGMIAAKGILTATGGTASHAALVARGMGRPCIVGAAALEVDLAGRRFTVGQTVVTEGDVITLDGTTGDIHAGPVPTIAPRPSRHFRTLLAWADDVRRLEVWANADYPRDAQRARANGAQGIGLCRTEHMFMEEERLPVVQAMILAADAAARERELARLLPFQRADFEGILRAMKGLPVVIRLIDPPLHEFLPNHDELLVKVTRLRAQAAAGRGPTAGKNSAGKNTAGKKESAGGRPNALWRAEQLLERVEQLREANPMLGLRGCRLSVLFPEITRMQVRAIIEAACVLRKRGVDARPEIMVPLVGHVNELRTVRAQLEPVASQVMQEMGVKVPYKIGTMIEVPRAALTAGEIATEAEFFSFGTNDLTQTTFGYSRDDAEAKFLGRYVEDRILPANPFETLDGSGVGRLMEIAVVEGRASRRRLEIGICGEHGGDAESIALCHRLGMDYVSCSPFRVPVARLAAAQAAVREGLAKASVKGSGKAAGTRPAR